MSEVTERLGAAGAESLVEPPAEPVHDELEDTQVVEHRRQRGEDGYRQHVEGKDRPRGALARQDGPEEGLYPCIRGVERYLYAVRGAPQHPPSEISVEHDECGDALDDQAPTTVRGFNVRLLVESRTAISK